MTRTGFLLFYLLAMLPTYLLPYFGSNSVLAQTALAVNTGTTLGLMGTVLHIGALVALIYLAWARGAYNGKSLITVFPVVAAVFDMVPLLSAIPLVPTVLHVIALVQGFDDKNELDDLDAAPKLARHPLLVLVGLSVVTVVVAVLVGGSGSVANGANAFKEAQPKQQSMAKPPAVSSAPPASEPEPTSPPLTVPTVQSPAAEPARSDAPSPAVPVGTQSNAWEYDESTDEMRGSRSVFATVQSTNTVTMAFPYDDPQPLQLMVRRKDNAKGKSAHDVIILITKGHIQCYVTSCTFVAKFDDEEPTSWAAAGAESHESNVIFVSQAEKFIGKLKASKRVIVEIPFFNEGRRQFKFELQPLELPAKRQ